MIVENDDNIKLTQIWLTKEEQNDDAIASRIRAIVKANKTRKYQTAVFNSGSGDLLDNTTGLVLRNIDG